MDDNGIPASTLSMLTRSQVARRLGKSIATVRRMEGRELHPERDERGILRFDPREVERAAAMTLRRLAASGADSSARHSSWFEAEVAMSGQADQASEDVQSRDEGAPVAVEERIRKVTADAVRQEFDRQQREVEARRNADSANAEQKRAEREAEEFLIAQAEFLDLINSSSPRELRALLRDPEFSAIAGVLLDSD